MYYNWEGKLIISFITNHSEFKFYQLTLKYDASWWVTLLVITSWLLVITVCRSCPSQVDPTSVILCCLDWIKYCKKITVCRSCRSQVDPTVRPNCNRGFVLPRNLLWLVRGELVIRRRNNAECCNTIIRWERQQWGGSVWFRQCIDRRSLTPSSILGFFWNFDSHAASIIVQ